MATFQAKYRTSAKEKEAVIRIKTITQDSPLAKSLNVKTSPEESNFGDKVLTVKWFNKKDATDAEHIAWENLIRQLLAVELD